MNLGRGARISIGVVVMLLAGVDMFVPGVEQAFGSWAKLLVAYALMFAGLWLIIRKPTATGE